MVGNLFFELMIISYIFRIQFPINYFIYKYLKIQQNKIFIFKINKLNFNNNTTNIIRSSIINTFLNNTFTNLRSINIIINYIK